MASLVPDWEISAKDKNTREVGGGYFIISSSTCVVISDQIWIRYFFKDKQKQDKIAVISKQVILSSQYNYENI